MYGILFYMIKSLNHISFILRLDKTSLLELASKSETYYSPFNKNGRDLNVVSEPLYSIQKILNRFLQSNIIFPNNMFGGLKGKNNIKNAKAHLGRKYKFKTDIKSYFPSISSYQVYKAFINLGFSADVSSLLTKLTTSKGQLPQGAPTSTTIANIVLLPIFVKLNEYCKKYDITITNFVDDITFSCSKDFKDKVPELLDIIRESGLRINLRKTLYKVGNLEVTGVLVKNNVLSPSLKTKEKLNLETDIEKKEYLLKYVRRFKTQ